MSADALLSRLNKVKRVGPGRWMACCPAHPDKTPSLSIREADGGTVLINDFGGCGAAEIMAAVGLEDFSELFPPSPVDRKSARPSAFKSDVFGLILFETSIVWLIGCDLHKSRAMSEADHKRLGEALAKLERIGEA
jgi:hypothetical protein